MAAINRSEFRVTEAAPILARQSGGVGLAAWAQIATTQRFRHLMLCWTRFRPQPHAANFCGSNGLRSKISEGVVIDS
jgi:hypothetical protein